MTIKKGCFSLCLRKSLSNHLCSSEQRGTDIFLMLTTSPDQTIFGASSSRESKTKETNKLFQKSSFASFSTPLFLLR